MRTKFKNYFLSSLLLVVALVARADDFTKVSSFVRGTGFQVVCDPSLNADPMRKMGPHFFLHSTNTNPASAIPPSKLKIMFYNFLNLATSPGKYQDVGGIRKWVPGAFEKSDEQIQGMYRLILAESPDIIVGSEIESLDGMEKSSKGGLSDQYFSLMVPDYDERINIGFFIRKMAFDIEVQSYREMMHEYLGEMHHLFSRDLPILKLRPKGAPKDSPPSIIIVGTHFKSMRDTVDHSSGKVLDRESQVKRAAQIEAATKIIQEIQDQNPGVPIVFGGDFNTHIEESEDIETFKKKTGFFDSFDMMGLAKKSWARATHSFFPKKGMGERTQMDAAFLDSLSKKLGRLIRAYVAPHRFPDGRPKPLPNSYDQREHDASDHRAVVIELDISKKQP